jgi:hypothetical protein
MEITDPKEILKSTLQLCYKMDYLDQYFLSFSLHQNLGTFAFHRNNLGENISIFQVLHNTIDNSTYKGFRSIKEVELTKKLLKGLNKLSKNLIAGAVNTLKRMLF